MCGRKSHFFTTPFFKNFSLCEEGICEEDVIAAWARRRVTVRAGLGGAASNHPCRRHLAILGQQQRRAHE
jgi:hypothetical protein